MLTTTTTTTATATATVSVVETVHGAERKPRSAQQWEEISHANTQKVTQMGTNVPLAWVRLLARRVCTLITYANFQGSGKGQGHPS
jgi:hypothetical protein